MDKDVEMPFFSNLSKTVQTAVLSSGDDGADASVVELELREVRPEGHGLNQVSYGGSVAGQSGRILGSYALKH